MKRFSVVYSAQAVRDLERFLDFELATEKSLDAVELIADAVSILARHPFIGRNVEHGLRELVISQGRTGNVALYRIRSEQVEVLRLRHQRELDYRI